MSGDPTAKGIVYRLQIPEDKVRRATTEGAHKGKDEFCVPGGVPRAWFVDAERGGVPSDDTPGMVSDTFAFAGRAWFAACDSAGALQRELAVLGFSRMLAAQIAAGLKLSMMGSEVIVGQTPADVATDSARRAALSWLGRRR